MNLEGKIVVITGGSRGIGRGIAEKFASVGSKIVITDINGELAVSTAKEIEDKYHADVMPITMDVADEDSVNSGFKEIEARFGSVDILISNAGIQCIHPIDEFPFNEWKRLIDIHVHGSFLTSKATMQLMKKNGNGGSIILMGSVHSVEASKNKSAYVAAKHALLGMIRAIAKEGAPYNIRSNLICPGFVRTPLVEKQIPEQAETLGVSEEDVVKKVMLGQTVDGEFTTIDDVAEIAIFFAGFPTNALTGQSLIVSHGWNMG